MLIPNPALEELCSEVMQKEGGVPNPFACLADKYQGNEQWQTTVNRLNTGESKLTQAQKDSILQNLLSVKPNAGESAAVPRSTSVIPLYKIVAIDVPQKLEDFTSDSIQCIGYINNKFEGKFFTSDFYDQHLRFYHDYWKDYLLKDKINDYGLSMSGMNFGQIRKDPTRNPHASKNNFWVPGRKALFEGSLNDQVFLKNHNGAFHWWPKVKEFISGNPNTEPTFWQKADWFVKCGSHAYGNGCP